MAQTASPALMVDVDSTTPLPPVEHSTSDESPEWVTANMSQTDLNTAGWTEINELLHQTQQENMAMRQQLELLKQENRTLKDKITALDSSMQYSKTDYEKAMLLALEGSSRSRGESPILPTEPDSTTLERMPSESSLVNDLLLLPFLPSSSSDGSGLADDPSNASDNNWDIVSSEGEGSVACLQDRILQMEENHYTVNEELQATLQELTDLQENNNFLSLDNDKLNEEKVLLFELLCQRIEKAERLEKLTDHFNTFIKENKIDYDSKKYEEEFKCDKEEINKRITELMEASKTSIDGQKLIATLIDQRDSRSNLEKLQNKLYEMEQVNEELINEKEKLEGEIVQLNETIMNFEEGFLKVKVQLKDEQSKSAHLVEYQDPDGNLNLDMLLENARSEKEQLDNRCTQLERELQTSKEETENLHEELVKYQDMYESEKDEELTAMKQMMDELECEKQELETEVINLKDAVEEMDVETERLKADTQQHLQTISDLNKSLQNLKQEKQDLQRNLNELKRTSTRAADEWKSFQADLQLAVVIANDYRSEAQSSVDLLTKERKDLIEKITCLNQEIERLNKVPRQLPSPVQVKPQPPLTESEIRKRMQAYMKPVEKELAQLRQGGGRKKTQPLSVKSLVQSIESVASQNGSMPVSPNPVTEPDKNIFAPTSSNGSSGRSSPAFSARPSLERRNTTVSQKTESKTPPPLLRRASTPVLSPVESRKSLSPSAVVRTPTTRTDARQAIGDVLYRRSDFPSRKTSSGLNASPTNNTTTKDSTGIKTSTVSSPRRPNEAPEKKDPLTVLVRHEGGGSKRNALLRWCQNKTQGYTNIDITNFSSSWNDGLGFCALIHSYLPHMIPFNELNNQDQRRNFTLAFLAAESVGISSILDVEDMVKMERPDWQSVMTYITSIYTHFET
ncbi:cytospin-A-like isoform X2 [Anneissia japonica]|uniref:cytospin-A-like isoform X2 n=1 Tax=Anneissia japonica TaxID=1529436 RepID=UPI001425904D|nr:cytospin-A-like isoform X2 [Anneissia japonica]